MEQAEAGLRGHINRVWPQRSRLGSEAKIHLRY